MTVKCSSLGETSTPPHPPGSGNSIEEVGRKRFSKDKNYDELLELLSSGHERATAAVVRRTRSEQDQTIVQNKYPRSHLWTMSNWHLRATNNFFFFGDMAPRMLHKLQQNTQHLCAYKQQQLDSIGHKSGP